MQFLTIAFGFFLFLNLRKLNINFLEESVYIYSEYRYTLNVIS